MKKLFALCLVVIIFNACTTGQSARTSSTLYAPRDSSTVEIFFEKPDRPYTIIGTVACKAHTFASDDAVLRSMQKEAGELGAHGILFQGYGEVTSWDGGKLKNGRGLAIRWKDGKAPTEKIAMTPTSTDSTTPKETQVIPNEAAKSK